MKTVLLYIVILAFYGIGFAFSDPARDIREAIEKANTNEEKAELYLNLGDVFEFTNPQKAIEYYEQALNLAREMRISSQHRSLTPDTDMLIAQSLRYIGIVHSNNGNFQEALEKYFEAQQILKELLTLYTAAFRREIQTKIAKLANNIGVVYSRQGVFTIAADYYEQALAVHRELADSTSIAVTYSSLGILEARQANLPDALRYFQQALNLYTLTSDKQGMAQSYNNIAGIHFQLENWDQSLYLFQNAHEIFLSRGQNNNVAATLNNIGLVYKNKNDLASAEKWFEKSLQIRLQMNDLQGLVDIYNNLGELASVRNDNNRATEFYLKSFEIAEKIGDNRMIGVSHINLGNSLFLEGRYQDAYARTQLGLEIARVHNHKYVIQAALKQLSDFHSAQGNYRTAFSYFSEYYEISQQILDDQRWRQINELEIEFNAREKQRTIDLLKQETEFTTLKLRQSRVLTIIMGLVFLTVVIIGIFAFIIFRQRNRIEILKKENQAKQLLSKTDNDLKAILKTHAHGMLLFDITNTVVEYNIKAKEWFEKFLRIDINEQKNFFNTDNPFVNSLSLELLHESLKGFSREVDKDIELDGKTYHFKFYSNPVLNNGDNIIQSVSLMIEDVTEDKNIQDRILSDLKEKETLIKEIHHRVKNNMQVIMSLIRLQSMQFKDKEMIAAFRELEQRIAAMSFVHEDLYKSENLSDIKFEDYLRKISSNLSGAYNSNVRVNNHVSLENPYLDIDTAMPCGLVINEIVSNSLKHAFNGGGKSAKGSSIDIFFSENENDYTIQVKDNGTGLKTGIDPHTTKSMGFHLIKVIVEEQLRGRWDIKSDNGLTVVVTFPK